MSAACGNEAAHLALLLYDDGWSMACLMVLAQRFT
jgi:hypothetical protein